MMKEEFGNYLIRFNDRENVEGFTFHKNWWGEFSHNGKLITVYAYPFTQINNWDWTYRWSSCRVFYPFNGGFVSDNLHIDDVPNAVAWHFWELAEQDMLDQREEMARWDQLE